MTLLVPDDFRLEVARADRSELTDLRLDTAILLQSHPEAKVEKALVNAGWSEGFARWYIPQSKMHGTDLNLVIPEVPQRRAVEDFHRGQESYYRKIRTVAYWGLAGFVFVWGRVFLGPSIDVHHMEGIAIIAWASHLACGWACARHSGLKLGGIAMPWTMGFLFPPFALIPATLKYQPSPDETRPA